MFWVSQSVSQASVFGSSSSFVTHTGRARFQRLPVTAVGHEQDPEARHQVKISTLITPFLRFRLCKYWTYM